MAILQAAGAGLRARVEGYRKSDTPAFIAARFAELVLQSKAGPWKARKPRRPAFVGGADAVRFPIVGGTLWLDRASWREHAPAIVAQSSGLLRDDRGTPALAVTPEELVKKDSELIACEVECRNMGIEGVFVELEIPGLDHLTTEDTEGHRGGA